MKVDTGFLIGVDLGQARDYTALAIAQRFEERVYYDATGDRVSSAYVEEHRTSRHARGFRLQTSTAYDLVHLERLPLGTPYPDIVRTLRDLLARPQLQAPAGGDRNPPALVVDATGVGRPVVDALRSEGLSPVAITIVGGDAVTSGGGTLRVPKRDLVGLLSVQLQNGTLRIAEALPHARTLTDELLRFKVKIDPVTTHDSYGAWRDGEHDDLVLAVAIACWWGERRPRPARPEDFTAARAHA